MQYKDKLYIKDQIGNVREWYITFDNNSYCKHYGILNGNYIPSNIVIKEGKNIGKSNETTIEQQVIKECESAYKDQKKRGYKSLDDLQLFTGIAFNDKDLYIELNKRLSSSKTDENNYLKPMKAQKYVIGCMKFPVLCQVKINGVRATIKLIEHRDGLFGNKLIACIRSKEGFVYNIPHLEQKATEILKNHQDIVLDGEIYISGEHVTSIGGAARNINNPLNSKLGFICYDLSIPNLTQLERIEIKDSLLGNNETLLYSFTASNMNKDLHSNIFNCPTTTIYSEKQVISMMQFYINCGFEGAIIRDTESDYKFGSRSKNMRKCKKFDDSEFEILDIVAGEKDGNAIFICKNDLNDLTFRVDGTSNYLNPEFIESKHLYIGKLATIKFYERTINNLPFHTTLIGIRDYEY